MQAKKRVNYHSNVVHNTYINNSYTPDPRSGISVVDIWIDVEIRQVVIERHYVCEKVIRLIKVVNSVTVKANNDNSNKWHSLTSLYFTAADVGET